MKNIVEIAQELGVPAASLDVYGHTMAKVKSVDGVSAGGGRLVLVSAINPAPAGEGKTTVSIGLAMGLRQLGKRATVALREPSLGPLFGIKGGATGGGQAVLVPGDAINLHFTGDMHAVSAAHNLLAALIDNALHFNEPCGAAGTLDGRQVFWPRVLDMNDRALRHCVVGLGSKADGVPRQTRFDITAASEVMAILALAQNLEDLHQRLSRIVVGYASSGQPVTAAALQAHHAMAVLLRQALLPNLVQTADGGPALVHCGPFANIAHGCSSLIATQLATQLSDYVITEAGFGFDLGGEKFLNIKCRAGNIWPRAVVIVASLRSLKMHGGAPLARAAAPNMPSLRAGLPHLEHHLASVAAFGLPAVVALNVFAQDRHDELSWVHQVLRDRGIPAANVDSFSRGGAGAVALAEAVCAATTATPLPRLTYQNDDSIEDKAHKVAQSLYGASGVRFTAAAVKQLARFVELGFGSLPICMAKTAASLTDDPLRLGRPTDFIITVREVRLSAGAGFLVLLTGDLQTMPGLPRAPASQRMRLGTTDQVMWNTANT